MKMIDEELLEAIRYALNQVPNQYYLGPDGFQTCTYDLASRLDKSLRENK